MREKGVEEMMQLQSGQISGVCEICSQNGSGEPSEIIRSRSSRSALASNCALDWVKQDTVRSIHNEHDPAVSPKGPELIQSCAFGLRVETGGPEELTD
jgi:hypothetical protein